MNRKFTSPEELRNYWNQLDKEMPAGKKIREVAKHYDIADSTAKTWLHKCGLTKRRKGKERPTKEQLEKLWEKKQGIIRAIQIELEAHSWNLVRKWLIDYGIIQEKQAQTSLKKGPDCDPEALVAKQEPVKEIIPKDMCEHITLEPQPEEAQAPPLRVNSKLRQVIPWANKITVTGQTEPQVNYAVYLKAKARVDKIASGPIAVDMLKSMFRQGVL